MLWGLLVRLKEASAKTNGEADAILKAGKANHVVLESKEIATSTHRVRVVCKDNDVLRAVLRHYEAGEPMKAGTTPAGYAVTTFTWVYSSGGG